MTKEQIIAMCNPEQKQCGNCADWTPLHHDCNDGVCGNKKSPANGMITSAGCLCPLHRREEVVL